MSRSTKGIHERILIVDTNMALRESLAQRLRVNGLDVVTAANGEQAFYLLRDWRHPIDWLYTRATLPGLIDGWILADEYHDSYPDRAAVIATSNERTSGQGHLVLKEPSLVIALEAIRDIAAAQKPAVPADANPLNLAA